MKQGKLAKELGITALEVGRIRKRVCADGEYDPETKELTSSGADKIREARDRNILEPQFIWVKMLRPCTNPRYLECELVREGHDKRKIMVGVPRLKAKGMAPGHRFEAQVVEHNGNVRYRHKILYEWENRKHG